MSVFSSAAVCLPPYAPHDARWQSWAAIACDQFTSELGYWRRAEAARAGAPSTLDLFLPEAYLGTPEEAPRRARIASAMTASSWRTLPDAMVYLERTLPDGRVRRGLVGKIDLEAYDYAPGSAPAVRATEATVLERIPPRVEIRAQATVELPHVMVLTDGAGPLFSRLPSLVGEADLLYDFDLMLGGGRAVGHALTGAALDAARTEIAAYEAARGGAMMYAVGDGNHSLAAAKAHYESLKRTLGKAAARHPARYALVELVDVGDPALDFEPIYRIVTHVEPAGLLAALEAVSAPGSGAQSVRFLCGGAEREVHFVQPTHALTVGTLQDFLDGYLAAHPAAKCDYIHGEASLRALSGEAGAVGFLFDGMRKEALFPYVLAHGTLPRKTFSMGEAASKRYYIEARSIVL